MGDVATPVYGWPYQSLVHAPNGALLGEELALAIESTVQPIDTDRTSLLARVTALENAAPYRDRQTVSVATATITFSGIPSTLRALHFRWTARASGAVASSAVTVRINADAGAVYNYQFMQGTGAGAYVGTTAAGATSITVGALPGSTSPASLFADGLGWIPGWDSPHAGSLGMSFLNGSQRLAGGIGNVTIVGSGEYQTAGPYTSISFTCGSGNFVVGSDFQIWGDRA